MIKFVTTSYKPLDKDIIREMWVQGDLKDRLGIKHRKDDKAKGSKLEFTPMFHEPHCRSTSEVSTFSLRDQYQPTMTRSPGSSGLVIDNTLVDTPPRKGYPDLEAQGPEPYIITKPSFEVGEDDPTPVATISRNPITGTTGSPEPPSPHPSYYSASQIPSPSPVPDPIYRYTTGEIASSPPTRAPSLYTVRGTASPPRTPHYTLQPPPVSHGPTRRNSGGSSSGAYEMRVRSPPHDETDQRRSPPLRPSHSDASRGVSEVSYATAPEDEWLDDGAHLQPSHIDGSTIANDDRLSAVYDHSRPASGSSFLSNKSWNGGRAM